MANEQQEQQEQAAVSRNPLDYLTDEQKRKQNSRFNKSWAKAHNQAVQDLIVSTGLEYNTAAFIVALREDSDTLISNERIADAVDAMLAQTRSMFGSEPTRKSALHEIKNTYEKLNPFEQTSAGKNFRGKLVKLHNRADFNRILDAVIAYLEVQESEWCA